MNTLHALALGGVVPILASSAALAQNGNMMNGGTWGGGWMGGYAGVWMPILLVVVVVGVVLMVVKRK
jgi:uncharacterized membrane protein